MDIYRLIKLCGILVILWIVKVLALAEFHSGFATNPPVYNIIDNFQTALSNEDSLRPLTEVAEERGWDASAPFVDSLRAQELENEYQWTKRKALATLFLALLAGVGIATIGRYIWGSWFLGITAAVLGPLGIAWGMSKLKNKG